MTARIVAIDSQLHREIRIKSDETYEHAKDMHLCLIQIHEFVAASGDYPIAFIKDPDTAEFRSVTLFGLKPRENVFFNADCWQASYIPNAIKLHPWSLTPSPASPSQLTLSLDMDSYLVNKENGRPIFDQSGCETPYLQKVKTLIEFVHNQIPASAAFIKHMATIKLLSPHTLTVKTNMESEPTLTINGLYTIDASTLAGLSDADFLELRRRHYLPIIYAHMASLNQVEKIAKCRHKGKTVSIFTQ